MSDLVCNVGVDVLAEGVALGQARRAVFDQIERLEGPERREKLLHLQTDADVNHFGVKDDHSVLPASLSITEPTRRCDLRTPEDLF